MKAVIAPMFFAACLCFAGCGSNSGGSVTENADEAAIAEYKANLAEEQARLADEQKAGLAEQAAAEAADRAANERR